MGELESRCLDSFPDWLRSLGDDARALAALVEDDSLDASLRRRVAGAVNYLFKSLDLIPDGIEDLGFIDDAFVFRVAAAGTASASDVLKRLGEDAELVKEFLGADYARLDAYVTGLDNVAARGRSVDEIMGDDATRGSFVREVQGWADAYAAPSFGRDEKNLVKLRAFLTAKLPA